MSRLGVEGALAIQMEKTQSYSDAHGGVAEVTMADGAALCAGMYERYYNAMRLLDMRDESVAKFVRIELWRYAMETSAREKWRGKVARGTGEHDKPLKLAELAIMEALHPVRFAMQDSWQLRAAHIGVKKAQYFEVWKSRYDDVFMRLQAWSDSGRNYLKTQCKKNNDE